MAREYNQIQGAGELARVFSSFEAKLQKKVIRKAVRDAAKGVAKVVKSRAPVLSGRVKASVKVRAAKRKKNTIAANVEVTGGHPDAIIGFVEFGRTGQDPNPFIRNSFEAGKDAARQSIEDQLRDGIEAATK